MAIFSDNSVGGIIDKFNNSDTPANGDVMTYNGSTGKWEATAPSGGTTTVIQQAVPGGMMCTWPDPGIVVFRGCIVFAFNGSSYTSVTGWAPYWTGFTPGQPVYLGRVDNVPFTAYSSPTGVHVSTPVSILGANRNVIQLDGCQYTYWLADAN